MKNLGFTLIELLVVIAIMAGLVGLLLPQLSKFNKSQVLLNAAAQLQSDVRLTQNNALSGTKCSSGNAASSWSLRFINASSYRLESTCSGSIVANSTKTMPSGVSIGSVEIINGNTPCSLSIANSGPQFSNISGSVSFMGVSGSFCTSGNTARLRINLQNTSDSTKIAPVIVEKGGSVYLEATPSATF